MWLRMSAAPWCAILIDFAQTLHLARYGFSGMLAIKGHVFVHCLLNFILYLKAPEYLDISPRVRSLCLFGEPVAVTLSLSDSPSSAAR